MHEDDIAPAGLTTLALVGIGATSSGGLAAPVVRRLKKARAQKKGTRACASS